MKSKKTTEQRPLAVALKYREEVDKAPKVIAKGKDFTAEKIIEVAQQHGIPLHSDADLAELLSQLDINQEIPPELYEVIAEILAFVYRLKDRWVSQRLNPI